MYDRKYITDDEIIKLIRDYGNNGKLFTKSAFLNILYERGYARNTAKNRITLLTNKGLIRFVSYLRFNIKEFPLNRPLGANSTGYLCVADISYNGITLSPDIKYSDFTANIYEKCEGWE